MLANFLLRWDPRGSARADEVRQRSLMATTFARGASLLDELLVPLPRPHGADLDEHLPDVLAAEQAEEGAGGVVDALDDGLPVPEPPSRTHWSPRSKNSGNRSQWSLMMYPWMRRRFVTTMNMFRGPGLGSTSL